MRIKRNVPQALIMPKKNQPSESIDQAVDLLAELFVAQIDWEEQQSEDN